MVQVTHGQSQLSGWGHYAEPTALFINKTPDPFMVGDVIDVSATLEPGGTELHFTDGTILSYRQSGNLLPALDNVTVWSVPAAGTTVPNDLDYVEIHASYTTKHGKTIKAVPVKVPVATPSYLRFILPTEPLVDEGQYLNVNPSWFDGETKGFRSRFMPDARLVVYWVDSHGDVVAASDVEQSARSSLSLHIPFNVIGPPIVYIMPERTGSQTVTRYRSINDEGEEITIENSSGRLWAEYTINGVTVTGETYFKTNPIVNWGFYNMPMSYSGTTTVALNIEKHTKVKYKNGKVLIGRYADNGNYWLSIWFRTKRLGAWRYYAEETITLGDNIEGTVGQYCLYTERDGSNVNKVSNKRKYTCSGGQVTWSNEPIE